MLLELQHLSTPVSEGTAPEEFDNKLLDSMKREALNHQTPKFYNICKVTLLCRKMAFFPEILGSENPFKITQNNSQGIIFTFFLVGGRLYWKMVAVETRKESITCRG